MVCKRTRMDPRLEALERMFKSWGRSWKEERLWSEMMENRAEVQEARLRKWEELMEMMVRGGVGDARNGEKRSEESESGTRQETSLAIEEDRWRKLDISLFAVEDAYGSVSRFEIYF